MTLKHLEQLKRNAEAAAQVIRRPCDIAEKIKTCEAIQSEISGPDVWEINVGIRNRQGGERQIWFNPEAFCPEGSKTDLRPFIAQGLKSYAAALELEFASLQ